MNPVPPWLRWLRVLAVAQPERIALDDGAGKSVAYGALPARVLEAARALRGQGATRIAVLAQNGVPGVLADLGATLAGVAVVPLPDFFSDEQLAAIVDAAEVRVLLTDDARRAARVLRSADAPRPVAGLLALRRPGAEPRIPDAARITFTSGSSGTPKGVLLRADAQFDVAQSVAHATGLLPGHRHLCVLPLAILLEQVGGVYRALAAGATALVPRSDAAGFHGFGAFDGREFLAAAARLGATDAILVPALLDELVHAARRDPSRVPPALRFLGVGGAKVRESSLMQARELGLPAYEGFGLTECASVVTLNVPGADRVGSAGRPLPHARVAVDANGEIWAGGALFAGYLDGRPVETDARGRLRTGDLGAFDSDGFLHLHGRRGAQFKTSFGRALSPEWVEHALLEARAADEVVVFGQDLPFPVAVVVSARPEADVRAAVAAGNQRLPAYARVAAFALRCAPLSRAAEFCTSGGKIARPAVERAYRERLAPLVHATAPDEAPESGAPTCLSIND